MRRVMLDLEGVERPAVVGSHQEGTKFAVVMIWDGMVAQLDPTPDAMGQLGLLSKVHEAITNVKGS
jgi:hypothetical protein